MNKWKVYLKVNNEKDKSLIVGTVIPKEIKVNIYDPKSKKFKQKLIKFEEDDMLKKLFADSIKVVIEETDDEDKT